MARECQKWNFWVPKPTYPTHHRDWRESKIFLKIWSSKWPWIDFSAFSWLPFSRFKAATLAFHTDSGLTFVGEHNEVQKSAIGSFYYAEIDLPKSSKSTFYDFGARNRSKYRKIVKRPRNLLPGGLLTSRIHFWHFRVHPMIVSFFMHKNQQFRGTFGPEKNDRVTGWTRECEKWNLLVWKPT